MPESRTSPRRLSAADKQRQALELRRAGVTHDEIARRLGYGSRAGAYAAVQAALKATLQEPAAEVRQLELDRLDRLLRPWWERAIRDPADAEASDIVLKIMARRAKLLGLDAPKRLDIGNADGVPFKVYQGVDTDKV